jgi:hypothetical protein
MVSASTIFAAAPRIVIINEVYSMFARNFLSPFSEVAVSE